MTEQFGHHPEQPPSSPDQSIAVRGVMRVVDGWRRLRVGQLEGSIDRLDASIAQSESSLTVNQVTGQYARLTNVGIGIKEPTTATTQEDRENWITKASHLSKTDVVAEDGTVAETSRPIAKLEQRTKRKVERAEAQAVRPAGVVSDLHKIYDLPDEEAIANLPEIPNRRPERGNKRARELVDESLRRAKLLNDSTPARDIEPKLRLGTREHRVAIAEQRSQEGRTVRAGEMKRVSQAERIQHRRQRVVTRKASYVEDVAEGSDRKAKSLNRKIDRAERQKIKKQRKINSHRSKLN